MQSIILGKCIQRNSCINSQFAYVIPCTSRMIGSLQVLSSGKTLEDFLGFRLRDNIGFINMWQMDSSSNRVVRNDYLVSCKVPCLLFPLPDLRA